MDIELGFKLVCMLSVIPLSVAGIIKNKLAYQIFSGVFIVSLAIASMLEYGFTGILFPVSIIFGMSIERMQERIKLLLSEIDANEEENRIMRDEINALYAKIDADKSQLSTYSSESLTQE